MHLPSSFPLVTISGVSKLRSMLPVVIVPTPLALSLVSLALSEVVERSWGRFLSWDSVVGVSVLAG